MLQWQGFTNFLRKSKISSSYFDTAPKTVFNFEGRHWMLVKWLAGSKHGHQWLVADRNNNIVKGKETTQKQGLAGTEVTWRRSKWPKPLWSFHSSESGFSCNREWKFVFKTFFFLPKNKLFSIYSIFQDREC